MPLEPCPGPSASLASWCPAINAYAESRMAVAFCDCMESAGTRNVRIQAMTVENNEKERIFVPALTGIRAVAALWVLFGHYSSFLVNDFNFPSDSVLQPLFRSPYAGVDLFFILSGFIISYTYSKSFADRGLKASSKFWWKRFARIYPAYLFATLVAGTMFAVAIKVGHEFRNEDVPSLTPTTIAANILGIQTWVDIPSLDGPAWSVSSEFFAYAIFPLIALIMPFLRKRLMLFLSGALCIFSLYFTELQGVAPERIWQVFFEFLIGVIIYQLSAGTSSVPRQITSAWFRGAVWLAALAVIYASGTQPTEAHYAVAPIFAVAVWSYSVPSTKSSLLDSPVMVRLGLWSYSLYLLHRLIQNAASGANLRSTGYVFADGLIFILLIALAILSAGMLYHFVEEPARKYLNRYQYFKPDARRG